MTPKIIFKYSWVYDQNWKKWIKLYDKSSKKYPSYYEIQRYIKKVEKLWREDEEKVLIELSKKMGLKWKEKTIACYIVGRCREFSDPLTMPIHYKPDYFIDVLVHELIHQLLIQNEGVCWSAWKYFHEKYKDDEFNTRIHVPVHALHWHIFMRFFGEKNLKRELKIMGKYPDYKRAWDIVRQEGYGSIIKEFKIRVN